MSGNTGLESGLALAPGDFLRDELEARAMSQRELADRLDRPVQVISEIVNGKKAITEETALSLERVLGVSASFWLNLETAFQLALARADENEQLDKAIPELDRYPVARMESLGWLPSAAAPRDRVRNLLRFFGVASFEALDRRQEALGYRTSPKAKIDPGALHAWVRRGEIEGAAVETAVYNEKRFRQVIERTRSLTRIAPDKALPRLTEECAAAGVAVLLVPELPKVGANGVARWLTKDKALVQLNLRYKWADVFWFTFFHECAHVLSHQQRRVYVDLVDGRRSDVEETEADVFAEDSLIPPDRWEALVELDYTDPRVVEDFATQIGIAPGIVVGRLQSEQLLPWSAMTRLKVRFAWAD